MIDNQNVERGSVVINVEEYTYADNNRPTLKELKLNIKKGEMVGIMGRTGAGKTSTLMLLNGLIPHFYEGDLKGSVTANTMNTQRYRVQTLSRFIGLVLQDPETQIFSLTVDKDVAFGPSNLAFEREKIKEAVTNSLKGVGLSGYENRMTTGLSGGEKQRVAIAGVLAMNPEILVLDEPTSELDPIGKKEVYDLLTTLRKETNVTIIISGHDSEEMMRYVDRLIVLNDGKIAWEGEPKDLFKNIPLTIELGICPPEIMEIGYLLSQGGYIKEEKIFSSLDECAEALSQKIIPSKNENKVFKSVNKKNSDVVIEAKNLTYWYDKGKTVLDNVNVTIHKGEFVALIGKNGAGKTTFSKHLNGLLRPASGQIIINGKNTANMSVANLSREVGYVFQNPDHQIFAASVKEEIEYGLKTFGFSQSEREERVKNVLKFVGMENYEHRHPFSLGKGERQKLAVSTILAMQPDILVIDEPTTGQDWEGTLRMMKMLKELNEAGHTIFTITHDMRLAAEFADRVIVFAAGKIILDGKPSEVFKQTELLEKCFVTPPQAALLSQKLKSFGISDDLITVSELVDEIKQQLN